MKFVASLFFVIAMIAPTMSLAGDGTKGGNMVKDVMILAWYQAAFVLESEPAKKYFSSEELNLMIQKLTLPDPSVSEKECFKQKLCWVNTDPANPQPLRAVELNGHPTAVQLTTHSDVNSAIYIDVFNSIGLLDGENSQERAVIALVHEAGHAANLSDDLISDDRIINLLIENPQLITRYGRNNIPQRVQSTNKLHLDTDFGTATRFESYRDHAVIYYSNIGTNVDGNGFFSPSYGSCSIAINPNCRNPSDRLSLKVSTGKTTEIGQVYLIAPVVYPSANRSPPIPIPTLGTVLTSTGFSSSSSAIFNEESFGTLCSKLVATGVATDSMCAPVIPDEPVVVQLLLIDDANGNGLLDPGESVFPVELVIQSAIGVASSMTNGIGVIGFELLPGIGSAHISNIKLGGVYAGGQDMKAIRFYYVEGPDVEAHFDISTFGKITPILSPGAEKYFNIPLERRKPL